MTVRTFAVTLTSTVVFAIVFGRLLGTSIVLGPSTALQIGSTCTLVVAAFLNVRAIRIAAEVRKLALVEIPLAREKWAHGVLLCVLGVVGMGVILIACLVFLIGGIVPVTK